MYYKLGIEKNIGKDMSDMALLHRWKDKDMAANKEKGKNTW